MAETADTAAISRYSRAGPYVRGKSLLMEKIKIGKIVNAAALKGEVKIYHYSDYKERFEELESVIVCGDRRGNNERQYEIENVRYQKDMVIAKLKGVDDRNAAESLKGFDVFITEEDLRELPEDTFYIRDLIRCEVIDGRDGKSLGQISDVLKTGAQDIYQVELAFGGQALIPAVAQFIEKVDIRQKTVVIKVIPGLIPGTD
ncbi:MAG: ribosome maturation factor RimM [Anaerovoracaceae bacterium]